MPRKKSLEEFIAEAATIHNNKYNYSKVVYENSRGKIVVTCKTHGDFLISPNKHLLGQGCRICSGYVALTQQSFLERSHDKHGKLYDYSKTEVKSKHDKVVIICKFHGEFEQLPSNHIKGQGCPECAQIVRAKSQRYTSQEFINSVQSVFEATRNLNDTNYEYTITDFITFFREYNYHFYFESPKPHNKMEWNEWNNLITETMSRLRISHSITQ